MSHSMTMLKMKKVIAHTMKIMTYLMGRTCFTKGMLELHLCLPWPIHPHHLCPSLCTWCPCNFLILQQNFYLWFASWSSILYSFEIIASSAAGWKLRLCWLEDSLSPESSQHSRSQARIKEEGYVRFCQTSIKIATLMDLKPTSTFFHVFVSEEVVTR